MEMALCHYSQRTRYNEGQKNQISADLAHLEIMRGYNLRSTTCHMLSRSLGQKIGNTNMTYFAVSQRKKDKKTSNVLQPSK